MTPTTATAGAPSTDGAAPERAGLVLGALILVAAVANLNLSVANVALPDIGEAFDSSQTTLNLIAVGYSLGLAASVLWFGALGDRYGRKLMIVLGMGLSIPASILAGFAPSDEVLFIARVGGGSGGGHGLPDHARARHGALVGPGRTKAIALWSALGGGIAALGPLVSGPAPEHFDWGSVFLVTLPLAVLALVLAVVLVPAHVNESTEPVDNLGGLLSAVLVGGLVVAINFLPVPGETTLALSLLAVALVTGVLFFLRQRRAENPLYDLRIAARPTFWVAGCAGIIVFGSLMAAMFVNQQFLQNVLGYSTLEAGAAILPAVVFMVLVAPRSAKLVQANGSRQTLMSGQALLLIAFVLMLLLWKDDIAYWKVALPLCFLGAGVGLAGTPSSNSLDGLRAGAARRHGVGHGRPAARPRRRGDDVRARRAPHPRLCVRDGPGDRPVGQERHRRDPGAAPALLRERRGPREAEPPVREPDHGRGEAVLPRRRRLGVHRRDGRDRRGDGARLLLLSAARARGRSFGPRTTREDESPEPGAPHRRRRPRKRLYEVQRHNHRRKENTMADDDHTPVLDLLASMTADSLEASSLDSEELMLVRLAALVAMDAPPASYVLNLGAASELGFGLEDVQGVLAAVAPIVGTARVASATGNIVRALGFALEAADGED